MTVIVTGAAGFVGRHLCHHLEDLGIKTIGVDIPDRNILDTAMMTSLFANAKPDTIYHLAALPSVSYSWRQPASVWETNVLGSLSILDAMRAAVPTARILLMSTVSVHEGSPAGRLIDEASPIAPLSPYSASKAAAEALAQQHRAMYGTDILIVRPANIIGPGQSSAYVVPSLCRKILRAKEDGLTEVAVGNADAERDFIDVRDAAQALVQLVERGSAGRAYNVCTGVGTAIGTVAELLSTVAGVTVDIGSDGAHIRQRDSTRLVADPSRTATEIGWSAQTPLIRTLTDVWELVSSPRGAAVAPTTEVGVPR